MPNTDFRANFRRYTPEATRLLMRIERALGTIEASPLLPPAADQLRSSARVGTIHYSNLIEGNELPMIEAERAARGELEPETKAKVELVNYVDALDLLDRRHGRGALAPTPDLLLAVHREVTKNLGSEASDHFKPRHEGAWRDGRAIVVDRLTETVMHEGPPAIEVPARMRSLCDWLRSKEGHDDYPPPVLAGVAHYAVTDIHPFADGNGRVARLFATALLLRHHLLPGRLFSFERYYAEDRVAYYGALRSVRRNTYNMEAWLEYFLAGLVEEYERVAAKIQELGRLGLGDGSPLRLTSSQEKALSRFALDGTREFDRQTYQEAAGGISKSSANRDLKALTGPLLLRLNRGAKGARFRFIGAADATRAARGRPREWTDERIEAELLAFLNGRSSMPTVREFTRAGKRPLRDAMQRHGGLNYWFERVRRSR